MVGSVVDSLYGGREFINRVFQHRQSRPCREFRVRSLSNGDCQGFLSFPARLRSPRFGCCLGAFDSVDNKVTLAPQTAASLAPQMARRQIAWLAQHSDVRSVRMARHSAATLAPETAASMAPPQSASRWAATKVRQMAVSSAPQMAASSAPQMATSLAQQIPARSALVDAPNAPPLDGLPREAAHPGLTRRSSPRPAAGRGRLKGGTSLLRRDTRRHGTRESRAAQSMAGPTV
jgi:hypothetical protein